MSSRPSEGTARTGNWGLVLRRFGIWVLLLSGAFLLAPVPGSGDAVAMDRAEFGKVLKTIPPNGPFWQFGNVNLRQRSVKAGMAPAVFPHWSHRVRYTCRVCHLELGFSMRANGSGINRQLYLAGAFCGSCHDGKTAFTARDEKGAECERCHIEDFAPLQKRFEALARKLPHANFGNGIDWAKSLNDGLITPAYSLHGDEPMELPEKLKGMMKLGTNAPRSDVMFSHEEHFAELDCSSCHPDLFNIQEKGTKSFDMKSNIFGYFCGACHMLVSFPMNDCRRCHPGMSNRAAF